MKWTSQMKIWPGFGLLAAYPFPRTAARFLLSRLLEDWQRR